MTALYEKAHARAGDKGDTSILVVAPYDPGEYPQLMTVLTAKRIASHFGTTESAVDIVPIPGLAVVTVVVRERLDGGVTRSGGVDPHGKTLSSHLLDLDVPWTSKEEFDG